MFKLNMKSQVADFEDKEILKDSISEKDKSDASSAKVQL